MELLTHLLISETVHIYKERLLREKKCVLLVPHQNLTLVPCHPVPDQRDPDETKTQIKDTLVSVHQYKGLMLQLKPCFFIFLPIRSVVVEEGLLIFDSN